MLAEAAGPDNMIERGDTPEQAAMGDGNGGVDHDAVRAQLTRLLADPLFHNSRRYSGLLKFMVNRSIEGQYESLKERIIGIEVFGRPPDYDTSIDPTVRVAATEVRKRLALYYSNAEHKSELQIDVPLRSYVAEFKEPPAEKLVSAEAEPSPPAEAVAEPAHPSAPELELVESTTPEARSRSRSWYAVVCALIVVAGLVTFGAMRWLTPVSPVKRFWAPVMSGADPVLICVSSSAPDPELQGQAANEKSSGLKLFEFSQRRVNVSMTDVTAATGLARFLHNNGKDSIIRPARGTTLADLGGNPVVLFGGITNEWVVRLGSELHYRIRSESEYGVRWIEDSNNPASRAWAVDMSAPYEQVPDDYALISRVLDQSTGRWWIGMSGLTGIGTTAAYQLTMDPKAMSALSSELPKGWESKNLQVVIAVRMIQGSPGVSRVVAKYVW